MLSPEDSRLVWGRGLGVQIQGNPNFQPLFVIKKELSTLTKTNALLIVTIM